MDGFGSGTKWYWKNRYYSRLDATNDDQDHLPGAVAKPPSGKRRKPPSTSRLKLVKVAPPPLPHPSPRTATPAAPSPGSAASTSPVAASSKGTGTVRPTGRRRRFWRIRLTRPRLALFRRFATAPVRLLRSLQRGYIRMMLKFAGAMGGAAPEMAGYSLPRPALKEYDEKVLVEIYRALVAQGQVLVVPAADGGGVSTARLVTR